jgi:hypothetical protein
MKTIAQITQIVTTLGGTILDAGVDPIDQSSVGMIFRLGPLRVILSDGASWDHVSVSCANRVPRYEEMKRIKRICFLPDEWAMELHAPPSKHISIHPYVLHLWRPRTVAIPLPPEILV